MFKNGDKFMDKNKLVKSRHSMVMAEVFKKTKKDFQAFVVAEAIDFFNYERTLNDGANTSR